MSLNIVGIGEMLWDLLPTGRQLGGAPTNFAYHARALGMNGQVVSRVGGDANGRAILDKVQELGLSVDGIEIDATRPTGTVSVTLSADNQPSYTIHEGVAWDFLDGNKAQPLVAVADAVCFGTLAQRNDVSRSAIRKLITATPAASLRILDVNLRQQYHSIELIEESMALANVLKLNDDELLYFATRFRLAGDEPSQLKLLGNKFDLDVIALTRGERGSILYRAGEMAEVPGKKVQVVDTIGAGDSFTAAMTIGLLSNWPLQKTIHAASEVAGYVCTCRGATPPIPDSLRNLFLQP